MIYSNDGCTDEYKFVYYPDRNKVKILFKSSDTYTEPERDSAEEYLLEKLKEIDVTKIKNLTSKYDVNKIKEELQDELFDNVDPEEVDEEYTGIQVRMEKDAIVFTAYAEVNYRTLSKICDALDKVIAKYNRDCYFEPETSGRAVCYLY